ncbi:HEAT repeat domain-containing protein [Saccharibacillus kuerlensis]|uniref:Knr4/Smi1-like domain-containing protein n=1 Tax=Saccharibacillus kuerlensis TaxID=459527 RepID=A0ABQ2L557_9BACL|nr:HEAT repeat domain-containing protein [Saccharibacillus kuerlensis]GGO03819.1 hypothetical protein GCM10010969_28370 [Saccharibacillus kuerlensis]
MEKQAQLERQLERIVWKLKMAARRDEALKEFGASRHQYRMNEPLGSQEIAVFEKKYGVSLPEPFSEFIQQIGNGGAGPYYGIAELDFDQPTEFLNHDCRLFPEMTQQQWGEMTAFLDNSTLGAAQKESIEAELYGGLLRIGEMGWTFEMMLVMTGDYRGRIVYIDRSFQIPFFTYEANFLEWYERWLDEVIGRYDTGWFAMDRAEDDVMLNDLYLSNLEEKVKVSAIQGMHKLPKLKGDTLDFLLEQCTDASAAVRMAALEVLTQKDYAAADIFLKRALKSGLAEERLNAARQIDIHGEVGGGKHTFLLERLLPQEEDHRVLCQITRILEQGTVNPLPTLVPFFSHTDPKMRREAIFHAGQLPGHEAYASAFGRALEDEDEMVRRTAVGALEGLPLPEFLPQYERLLSDLSSGNKLRLAVLRRLEEYGSQAYELFERAAADSDSEIRKEARRLLMRFGMKMKKT